MPGRSSVRCSSTSISAFVVRVTECKNGEIREISATIGCSGAASLKMLTGVPVSMYPSMRWVSVTVTRIEPRIADYEQRRARRRELPDLGVAAADDARDRRADRRLVERAAPFLDERCGLLPLGLHEQELGLRG